MDTRWKRIAQTGGILLALPGVLFALNVLCIASLMALDGGSEAATYGTISLTLMLLTLGAGGVTYWHAYQSLKGRPSGTLRLPPLVLGWPIFGFLLLIGIVIKTEKVLSGLFFPSILLILAALPPLWAVAWFTPRTTESQLTWRRGLVAFCGGATVSVFLAIILEILIPGTILALIFNTTDTVLDRLGGLFDGESGASFARALTNPAFVYVFIQITIIAPLVEELVKPLATLPLLRTLNRQETFWVGALAGAGFAAVENVIYAGSGLPIWAGILLVRALGGALHPLGAGLVALGWHDILRGEPKALETWFKQYGLAVLIHAIWNGGSLMVITLGSAQFFGVLPEIGGLGISMTGVTLAFLFILGIAALWLGRSYGYNRPLTAAPIADGDSASATGFALSERAVALWALTCLLAIVPIGIAGLRLWLR